ncbi:GPI inositol-deacylase, partial [Rosenbergiella nectarea]
IRIDKIIAGYKASGRKCEKVILVTHSMGGLVARHYSEILDGNNGDKKILGIVHGVMPNLGSPMAYKRMKTGESG